MKTNENINALFEKFEQFIKSQTIVGEEIKVGNVTIIPLASISFGLGAGSGGSSNDGSGSGSGSGICAKATPQALLVIHDDNVNLLPIRKGSSFEALLDSVPALIDKIKDITVKEEEDLEA